MHLLMAAVEDENVWMVAATFIVTHAAGDIHIGPSPIVETVHSPGLIGYTGSAPAGYTLIREASNLPTSDNVFHFLINAHVANQELSFVYATYANGRPALIEIIDGVYTVKPAACSGTETPVGEFRKYLDSDSHPAESDYFFKLEAPQDPRGGTRDIPCCSEYEYGDCGGLYRPILSIPRRQPTLPLCKRVTWSGTGYVTIRDPETQQASVSIESRQELADKADLI